MTRASPTAPRTCSTSSSTTVAAVQSPEVTARYEELGISPSSFTPAEFREFVAAESRRWGDVARAANVKME